MAWGYAVERICGYAGMRVYAAGRKTGIGHWFYGSFIPYATRHTGVCALLGRRFQRSRRIRISEWVQIAGDQVSLTACVSLELVEFRECSVVVSQTERYISWPVLSQREQSEPEHRSSIFRLSSQCPLRSHFCSFILSCFPQVPNKVDPEIAIRKYIAENPCVYQIHHPYFQILLALCKHNTLPLTYLALAFKFYGRLCLTRTIIDTMQLAQPRTEKKQRAFCLIRINQNYHISTNFYQVSLTRLPQSSISSGIWKRNVRNRYLCDSRVYSRYCNKRT